MTGTPARHVMVIADRRDRRSPGRAAAGWRRRRLPRSCERIAARPACRTDRVASRAGPRELRPEYSPKGVFYSSGHPANRCSRSNRARGPVFAARLGEAGPSCHAICGGSSLLAPRRRYAGREHGRGAGALLDDPADAGVEPLDRADRLRRRGGDPREDAAVDRHQLAGRLCRDRRQALGARQISGELRQLRPIGSRDRCRR